MKLNLSTLLIAGAVAGSLVIFGSATRAEAGHKRHRHHRHHHHRHNKHFGFYLNTGDFGIAFGQGSPRYVGYHRSYRRPMRIYRPLVVPPRVNCCHRERVWVNGSYDRYGFYRPGYSQLVRTCNVHGRAILSTY